MNWDDPKYITENNGLQALSWEQVRTQCTSYALGNYHPLTMLSLALDVRLAGGKDPAVMHTTQVCLHVINVLLLFGFLRLLTGQAVLAALTALLFAVNPLRV